MLGATLPRSVWWLAVLAVGGAVLLEWRDRGAITRQA